MLTEQFLRYTQTMHACIVVALILGSLLLKKREPGIVASTASSSYKCIILTRTVFSIRVELVA